MRLPHRVRLRANGLCKTLTLTLMLTLALLLTASAAASPSITAISGATDVSASDTLIVLIATPQSDHDHHCVELKRELHEKQDELAQHQNHLKTIKDELQHTKEEIGFGMEEIKIFQSITPTSHHEEDEINRAIDMVRHEITMLFDKKAHLEADQRAQEDEIESVEGIITGLNTAINSAHCT
jgi:septal ring factor EnvC (AmiA/AmiB activator)